MLSLSVQDFSVSSLMTPSGLKHWATVRISLYVVRLSFSSHNIIYFYLINIFIFPSSRTRLIILLFYRDSCPTCPCSPSFHSFRQSSSVFLCLSMMFLPCRFGDVFSAVFRMIFTTSVTSYSATVSVCSTSKQCCISMLHAVDLALALYISISSSPLFFPQLHDRLSIEKLFI